MSVIFYSSPSGLEAACAYLAASNDPKLPLVRAAADGRIALAWAIGPDVDWPLKAVTLARPAVILIGDDPFSKGAAIGPAGWAIAKRLRTWPRGVIIHGAEGRPEHYRTAVCAAEDMGRCVMLETDIVHALAWAKGFKCPNTLLILPNGGVHPCKLSTGEMY